LILGLVAIVIMLKAPNGIWGLLQKKYKLELFPLSHRIKHE